LKTGKNTGFVKNARKLSANMIRLKEKYEKEIKPELLKQFNLKNSLSAPKLEKVIVTMGVGLAAQDEKEIERAQQDLELIVGQRAMRRKAKKAISSFKLRKGQEIGLKVTLRGEKMYSFLDKLFSIVLPRIRDFRGLPESSFDGQGNYSLGLTEQIIFPEIDYGKIDKIRGLGITIVTNTKDRSRAQALLKMAGMPFEKSVEK